MVNYGASLKGMKFISEADPKDLRKLNVTINKLNRTIPRLSNRTGRSIAEYGRDTARNIVRQKEATFDWVRKGQLANSIVVRNIEQSQLKNIFELVATAQYAFQVENGMITRREVSIFETPKLTSWARGAAESQGLELNELFPRGVMRIGGQHAAPWIKEGGMKFMKAGGDSMKSELKNKVQELGKNIMRGI